VADSESVIAVMRRTLLAFISPKEKTKNLAGFTVKVAPGKKEPFYLQNQLRFEDPTKHARTR
jgi:hypothetical protein